MSFLKNFFGSDQQTSITGAKTVLDLVTSTAALASNPAQIDPILDSVRSITSQVVPGQVLSDGDEAKIIEVYLRLEQYLITQEPIRNFTKEELRARLAPELLQRLTAYEAKNKRGD
jgi:flagellar biosynthesis component FlhA